MENQDKSAQKTSPREEGTAANQLAQSIGDFFTGIAQTFDYLAHWAVGKKNKETDTELQAECLLSWFQ